MKKICIALALFCAFFKVFADDDEKLKLAVMDLEDLSGKLSEETLTGASEYFRIIFAQTNRYIIISKDRQKEQISGLRKKYNTDPTYKSCTDKNCQIQLGQALSADLIVKTSVSFFAGFYTLASELIDLEKEATIIAATEEYDGTPQALRTAIKNIVNKIVEAEKKENSEPAPAAPVYREQPQQQQAAPVQSKDSRDCEQARQENSINAWRTYLRKHSKGECVEEAKENLDKMSCEEAEKENSLKVWKNYVKEFPDGDCVTKAKENIKNLEELEEKERERKFEGIISGRWNLGLGVAFNTPNKVGFGTGLDFNFKVFEKPDGGGAGNLFVGLGVDFKYWVKTSKKGSFHYDDGDGYARTTNHLMNIPIQANFGYEFKIKKQTLRYVGLWSSFGMGIDLDAFRDNKYDENVTFLQLSFAWDITMDMIFKNGMLMNIGIGGNKSNKKALKGVTDVDSQDTWTLDHTCLMIGTGVIF